MNDRIVRLLASKSIESELNELNKLNRALLNQDVVQYEMLEDELSDLNDYIDNTNTETGRLIQRDVDINPELSDYYTLDLSEQSHYTSENS